MNTRILGSKAESLACNYLESQGIEVIDRNWHFSNRGEIDIVAIDPKRFNERYLVFIEVKSREESLEASLRALSYTKQRQLKKLAGAYLQLRSADIAVYGFDFMDCNISFDFIAIHESKIEHLRDVFSI